MPSAARLGDVRHHLVGVVLLAGEQRGHELDRVMRLQICGLVGNQAIRGRMALIKTVGRESLHQIEDLVGELVRHAVPGAALDEPAALLGHDFGLLLPHRAAQQVCPAQRVAGEHLRDLHHLLLVDDDPVGVLENRLQERMRVGDPLAAVLAVDEDVHHPAVERPGAVEGAGGDDVLEDVGLELPHHLGEAARLHLEHARRVAARDDLVGLLVVERQERDVELAVVGQPPVDQLDRVVDDGERGEAEEVELDQPRLLHLVLGELGDQLAVLAAAERHVLPERLLADDHAGGVHAGAARQPFQRPGELDDLLEDRLLLLDLGELGLVLQRLLDGGRMAVDERGDVAGQLVHLREGQAHHPGHVLDRALRRERSVGDDLRDVLLPVLLGDVVDHLAAAVLAEVDVEVRHRDALGVEEALEEQVVGERVDVGDAQGIGDQGPCAGAAAGPHRDAVALGPVDEVLHDEEVAGEFHPHDHRQLALQPLAVEVGVHPAARARDLGEALVQPFPRAALQEAVQRLAVGDLEPGQVLVLEVQLDVAAGGDEGGVVHRLLPLGPHAGGGLQRAVHLVRRLDVELLRLVAQAPRIVEGAAGGDGHQHLVRPGVAAAHVVAVGGGDQRQPLLARERADAVVDGKLLLERVALDLQIEPVAEDRLEIAHLAPGLVHVAAPHCPGHCSRHARGQGDDALAVRLEQRLVDARVVVEAVGERLGAQVAQVAVAGLVLRQEHQVVADALALVAHALLAGDVRLEADDGFDAVLLRLLVEADHAEHVAVVGDGHRLHARGGARLHQIGQADGAVEEAVEGVQVQVREVCGHGLGRIPEGSDARSRKIGA